MAFAYNAKQFPAELFFKQDGNPYDYLKPKRDFYAKHGDSEYQKAAQKIFVEEYQDIVSRGAVDLDALVKLGGYTLEDAIALLSQKPLDQWSSVTQIIFDVKGKREAYDALHESAAANRPIITGSHQAYPESPSGIKVIDVVIRGEDTTPSWYKESIARDKKEDDGDNEQGKQATDEEPQNRYALLIQKNLYDRTRNTAETFISRFGIDSYLAILDQVTKNTGIIDADAMPTEQEFKKAEENINLLIHVYSPN
jgi:hypothetical protein